MFNHLMMITGNRFVSFEPRYYNYAQGMWAKTISMRHDDAYDEHLRLTKVALERVWSPEQANRDATKVLRVWIVHFLQNKATSLNRAAKVKMFTPNNATNVVITVPQEVTDVHGFRRALLEAVNKGPMTPLVDLIGAHGCKTIHFSASPKPFLVDAQQMGSVPRSLDDELYRLVRVKATHTQKWHAQTHEGVLALGRAFAAQLDIYRPGTGQRVALVPVSGHANETVLAIVAQDDEAIQAVDACAAHPPSSNGVFQVLKLRREDRDTPLVPTYTPDFSLKGSSPRSSAVAQLPGRQSSPQLPVAPIPVASKAPQAHLGGLERGLANPGDSRCWLNAILQTLRACAPMSRHALVVDDSPIPPLCVLCNLLAISKAADTTAAVGVVLDALRASEETSGLVIGEQNDAGEALDVLMNALCGGHGPLVDNTLRVSVREDLQCVGCHASRSVLTQSKKLSIAVAGHTTLVGALAAHQSEETVSVDCPDCSAPGKAAIKKLHFVGCSDVMVIELKRLQYDVERGSVTKLVHHVHAPDTLEVVTEPDEGPMTRNYSLTGVVHHAGETRAGHYTSTVVDDEGEWCLADDDVVRRIGREERQKHCNAAPAVLLFYVCQAPRAKPLKSAGHVGGPRPAEAEESPAPPTAPEALVPGQQLGGDTADRLRSMLAGVCTLAASCREPVAAGCPALGAFVRELVRAKDELTSLSDADISAELDFALGKCPPEERVAGLAWVCNECDQALNGLGAGARVVALVADVGQQAIVDSMCVALMGVSAAQRDAPMPSVLQAAGRARSWLRANVACSRPPFMTKSSRL